MSTVLEFGISTAAKPRLSWNPKFKSPLFFESNQVSFRRTPFQKNNACLLQTEPPSKSSSNNPNTIIQHSPTVSYLVESCGLSLDSALSASKKVQIETPDKPDSVLQLFRTYGFTEIQITHLITKYPQFLVSDADKTLKPKFEFYKSLGFSRPDLAKLIVVDRNLLLASLEQRIIPNVNFLKIILHTNKNIIAVIKRTRRIVYHNLQTRIEPKIRLLRAHGVPDSSITRLLLIHPRTFTLSTEFLQEAIKVVRELGFHDPTSPTYIFAVRAVLVMSKSKWEEKVEAYMSFGWSKDDFLSAFKLQPMFMTNSVKKIRKLVDFFVYKLGIRPCDLAICPNLFLFSLEKKIIPRCSVLQVLLSKGLIDKDSKIIWVLNENRKVFEKKYVTKFEEKAPEVWSAYRGEMGYPDLETLSSML